MTVEHRTTVRQFLPSLMPYDAVGNHTLAMRSVLAHQGMGGEILTTMSHPDVKAVTRDWREHTANDSRDSGCCVVLLYQAYVSAPELTDFLHSRDEPLVVYYHNITPPNLIDAYDPPAAALMLQGRTELRRLAPRIRMGLAASRFSAMELHDFGVREVRVLPPYGRGFTNGMADGGYLQELRDSKEGIDILFVGRVAPHKGHRYLLQMGAVLQASYSRRIRMFFVGPRGPEPYMFALHGLVERLGLEATTIFTDAVSDARLAAHYQAADVFVCMSQHEGYCLPLVEAMRAGVPIVAYRAGAVPETLGDGGILLDTVDPYVAAEAVAKLADDTVLSGQLTARQHDRVAQLDAVDRDRDLVAAMDEICRG
jgi:L-malate glycosyltransferase